MNGFFCFWFLLLIGIFKLTFDKSIETLGVGHNQMILESKASRKKDNHQLLFVSLPDQQGLGFSYFWTKCLRLICWVN